MTKARSWLYQLFHHSPDAAADVADGSDGANGHALAPRPARTVAGSAAYQWEVVASVNSAPLGGMYADLLRQAGIPVLARGWQSVPMAGAPIGVTLLVPQERLAEARTILEPDDAAPDELPAGAGQLAAPDQADTEADNGA